MAGRRQTAKMELAIGATIVAAIIILLVMLFVWGGSSSFFSNHYWVVVEMSNVGGLREGAPVKIGGFQIGKVNSIQLRPGATELDIILGIDDNRLIPKGSTGKISTAGLVGDAFLEIMPGRSESYLAKAAAIAEAERIPSSPVPDFSELLIRVEAIGAELNSLASHINDILGDGEFRQNVKTITANLVTVSYEATTLLQRGQRVVDNVERATDNVAILSDALKSKVEEVADNIVGLTDEAKTKVSTIGDNLVVLSETLSREVDAISSKVVNITDQVEVIAERAKVAVENLDGTIADVRRGVNRTLNDPQITEAVKESIENIRAVTATFSEKRGEIDTIFINLKAASGDLGVTASHVRDVAVAIDPQKVSSTVDSLATSIQGVTVMVDKVMADPVLALSVNKAADRIVKMKFDEMAKNNQLKSTDDAMRELRRWSGEALDRGHFVDPNYGYNNRPYAFDH
ncbi:MAG: MlaD family protein [Planctomycetota bacterium]|jgi:phospholipid/cholesterol/gamma-HCH transport system substrate-binding protein|nr:MlaD family protein [Planctomycetota bacterium]